jgi:hypothetical protein
MNKLCIGQVSNVGTATIIPVEQITVHAEMNSQMNWWYGSKELYALVITTPSGVQVYDKHAHQLSIDELVSAVPKLNEYLPIIKHQDS